MSNIIVVLILLVILAPTISYIVKSKKKGATCIGCPCASNCSKKDFRVTKEKKP